MSNLVDLYENSDKQRPAEARQIPGRETDMWDREHEFAEGFKTGRSKESPTDYTEKGLNQYSDEKSELVPPESFNSALPLHRYTPENTFYKPGESDTTAA